MLILMQTAERVYTRTWVGDLSAWVALGFLGLIGVAIIYNVFTGKIDLSGLISEPSGEASMSRFQLLVFTFVIAASLFLVIASPAPPAFPALIPNGILVLLGISSSSYLVSKGIQHSSPQGVTGLRQVTIKVASNVTTAGGPSIQCQAEVLGLSDPAVTWSIDPPTGLGTIDPNGLYTPPPAGDEEATGKVTIKVTAKEDVGVTDTETITLT
ncbi:MAG TPA: hypothetical protein VNO50_13605 [Pyrinomonadaceae bacterium]|nr:hypothetical protein [Pyrinomonadaceae bacterium]